MTAMPDEFPSDASGDALRRMRQNGDDLTKPRMIEFTVAFPSQPAADAFARQLRVLGYVVSVEESGTILDLPWDAIVPRNMVPSYAEITDFEDKLAELAQPFGGRNDGWGCLMKPKVH